MNRGPVAAQDFGQQPRKVVYFATGTPAEVVADLQRLELRRNGAALRVVVPAPLAQQLEQLAALKPEEMLCYRPQSAVLLWLRLWRFLGFSRRAEIICLSARQRFRFLKLLALTLRGRASFSAGNGTYAGCSFGRFLWNALERTVAGNGPIGIVGSASPELLPAFLASVRQRYPGPPVRGVLWTKSESSGNALLDSCDLLESPLLVAYFQLWRRCFGNGRLQRLIVPWTNENRGALRWVAWFLPIWHVEIYNENLDAFPGRNLVLLIRHGLWSNRQRRERLRRTLPVGVMGSASGFYLQKIVAALRSRFPSVPIHGLLPPAVVAPAEGLFDSVSILQPGLLSALREAFRLIRVRMVYQCWIVPCTDEPYYLMKLLAFLGPLTRRQIYNEQADGFAVRDFRTLWWHFRWRLRDHLTFQILAGTAGSGAAARWMHLLLYAGRLLRAVPLLGIARLRSYRAQRAGHLPGISRKKPRVDLVLLGAEEGGEEVLGGHHGNGTAASIRRVTILPGNPSLQQIHAAIGTSAAEFICVLDSRCQMSPSNWLDQLLDSFDETTAQVGPQIRSPKEETFVRGALFGSRQKVQWNTNHAARWHSRPEWLEVDGLPWVCVVIRRRALLEAGSWGEGFGRTGQWVDVDFCSRLAARGWRSLCNRKVTATHPLASTVEVALSRL